MNLFRKLILNAVFFVAISGVVFSGCGKKADTHKPLEQVKTEAQAMSLNDLQSQAKAYVQAIEAKKPGIEKISIQIKQLSPNELFGDKAKGIKDQFSRIQSEVGALTERYAIYAEEFQKKGGDPAIIKLG